MMAVIEFPVIGMYIASIVGGDDTDAVLRLYYVLTVILGIIVLSVMNMKRKQKNEQIDKMISYITELEKKEQEQQQLGNRAAAGILPDNMRNYDAVRELINMLEYKRAASLGEAMNILEMQKNSSSYNNY